MTDVLPSRSARFSLQNTLLFFLCLAPPLSVLSGKGSMGFMFCGMWTLFGALLYRPMLRLWLRFRSKGWPGVVGSTLAIVLMSTICGCVFGAINDFGLRVAEMYAYRYSDLKGLSVAAPYHIQVGSIVGAVTGLVVVFRGGMRADEPVE